MSIDKTESYSSVLGLYQKGKIRKLTTGITSSYGVYLDLDYAFPGKGWKNGARVLAEPGSTVTPNYYTDLGSNQKAS